MKLMKRVNMYEGELTCIGLNEVVWRRIRWIKVCEGEWSCMKVSEGVWRWMKAYVWRCTKRNDGERRWIRKLAWSSDRTTRREIPNLQETMNYFITNNDVFDDFLKIFAHFPRISEVRSLESSIFLCLWLVSRGLLYKLRLNLARQHQ